MVRPLAVVILGLSACGNAEVSPTPPTTTQAIGFTDLPDVVVDENGMRSFPDQTHAEFLDVTWNNLVQSLEADEAAALIRPDVELIETYSDFTQYAQAYVSCMHNAGWTQVTFNAAEQSIDASIPNEQMAAYHLSSFVCDGQYFYHVPPMNEEQIGMLWDYNSEVVLPCLADHGYRDVPFDSREVFIDRYFAQRSYTLPIAALGIDPGERHPCDTLPAFLEN